MSGDPHDPPARRMRLTGLHHVTAIVADLERSVRFYRDILGLALVREERNDDDPNARHFWFGDGEGSPGTLISLLEYPDMDQAREGRGGLHHFAVAVDSAEEQDAWREYLTSRGIPCSEIFRRGAFRSLYFRDPDGNLVEIATR